MPQIERLRNSSLTCAVGADDHTEAPRKLDLYLLLTARPETAYGQFV